jgi:hypothetical protein
MDPTGPHCGSEAAVVFVCVYVFYFYVLCFMLDVLEAEKLSRAGTSIVWWPLGLGPPCNFRSLGEKHPPTAQLCSTTCVQQVHMR